MKLIAAALIAATASVMLVTSAGAAPRKLPALLPANTSLQLVSIQHNRLKLHTRLIRFNQ